MEAVVRSLVMYSNELAREEKERRIAGYLNKSTSRGNV